MLAGIAVAGAGRTAAEARRPAVVEARSGGGRVLVWGLGHSSSGVPPSWQATASRPGVWVTTLSPQDVAELARQVVAHKGPGDVAVASVHWGGNWGFQVLEEQRRFAHALIDTGGRRGLKARPA